MVKSGFYRRATTIVALVISLFLSGASGALAADKMEEAQVKEIERIVRDYLLKNPEVINQALQVLQAKQAHAEKQRIYGIIKSNRKALDKDPGSVVIGNLDGDVTIVEFFDYNCPYCKRSYKIVKELLNQDKGIRLVFKEFPILGPGSIVASQAAIASRAQNLYPQFHDAMMGVRGKLTGDRVMQIAKEVGLDLERLKKDMKAPEVNQILSANHRLAQALNINGTPAYVIGDTLAPGYMSLEQFTALVEKARSGCTTC